MNNLLHDLAKLDEVKQILVTFLYTNRDHHSHKNIQNAMNIIGELIQEKSNRVYEINEIDKRRSQWVK